jgi:hypothetical protein
MGKIVMTYVILFQIVSGETDECYEKHRCLLYVSRTGI